MPYGSAVPTLLSHIQQYSLWRVGWQRRWCLSRGTWGHWCLFPVPPSTGMSHTFLGVHKEACTVKLTTLQHNFLHCVTTLRGCSYFDRLIQPAENAVALWKLSSLCSLQCLWYRTLYCAFHCQQSDIVLLLLGTHTISQISFQGQIPSTRVLLLFWSTCFLLSVLTN